MLTVQWDLDILYLKWHEVSYKWWLFMLVKKKKMYFFKAVHNALCYFSGSIFPMHSHTGTEDQCPEAFYFPSRHENLCVFVWCVYVCPQSRSNHPPTHTHHIKQRMVCLQALITSMLNSTEALVCKRFECQISNV